MLTESGTLQQCVVEIMDDRVVNYYTFTDGSSSLGFDVSAEKYEYAKSRSPEAVNKLKAAIKAVNDYSADVEKRLNAAQSVAELEEIMREVARKFGTDTNVKAITNTTSQENSTPGSVYYDWLKNNGFLEEG